MRAGTPRRRRTCKLFHWDNEQWQLIGRGELRIVQQAAIAVRFVMTGDDGTVCVRGSNSVRELYDGARVFRR